MKKAILAQKVVASVLAIGLGGFVLPLAAQANSGLKDEPQDVTGSNDFYYIGSNGAADNVVIIDSDLPYNNAGVIGGYTATDDVVNNRVTVSGGTVTGRVFGGETNGKGNATDNSVTISGGTVKENIYGGGTTFGNAEKNEVNISGGTVTGTVYGGVGEYAEKNEVNISGGIVTGEVKGGDGEYAEKNEVNISGGMVTGEVKGGDGKYAKKNEVNISGGMVIGDVKGGYTIHGEATGNSIILSGTADVSQANLYGGDFAYGSASDNKLIINGWSGTVKSLNNFNGAEGGIEVQALGGREYKVGDEITVITASRRNKEYFHGYNAGCSHRSSINSNWHY